MSVPDVTVPDMTIFPPGIGPHIHVLSYEILIIKTLKINLDTWYKTNFFHFSLVREKEKHTLKKGTETFWT